LSLLGRGGYGTVFKALRLDTGVTVAIKLIHPAGAPGYGRVTQEQQARRLRHEIAVCASLSHANIAALLDSGATGGGRAFAVFEYVPGETLREHLLRRGRIEARRAVPLMAQVLEALVHLHEQDIVHCDIKPQNIVLTQAGPAWPQAQPHAKLVDFGSAVRLRDSPDMANDEPGGCSPAYSAPEQLRGAAPSPGFDIYAWALVCVECLTGQAVVPGYSLQERIAWQTGSAPVPLPARLAGHALGALLRQALEKDWRRRSGDAAVLLRQLLQLGLDDLDDDPDVRRDQAPGKNQTPLQSRSRSTLEAEAEASQEPTRPL